MFLAQASLPITTAGTVKQPEQADCRSCETRRTHGLPADELVMADVYRANMMRVMML